MSIRYFVVLWEDRKPFHFDGLLCPHVSKRLLVLNKFLLQRLGQLTLPLCRAKWTELRKTDTATPNFKNRHWLRFTRRRLNIPSEHVLIDKQAKESAGSLIARYARAYAGVCVCSEPERGSRSVIGAA
ncbi:hypothetical protein [Rhizobium leguminosarum]|uniref:hypothetical protein n=1 Tax=Rhizobium leguminosarum TaxID=384 RepID=UPI001AE23FAE|nr:hypothetical protein [Rhizobium leguminosarum]MBP2448038.1 hypothetical protein [Rhizobium leguminosarum]